MSTEAALAFPLFFLACVLLALLLEMAAIDIRVRSGVVAAAREVTAGQTEHPVMSAGELSAAASRAFGFNALDEQLVEGGSGGVSFEGSAMDAVTGIGTVRWTYRVRLPFPVFGADGGEHKGSVKVKAWNGYHGDGTDREDEEIVYVTPYGVVYHRNPSCTHLSLSVTAVSSAQEGACRNPYGKKYYPCAHCARLMQTNQTVYIAQEGDRYHADRQCSGLKRSVEAIPLSQAGGRRPCSRCSQ